jgi:putative hydrolase of the HAD superfamily
MASDLIFDFFGTLVGYTPGLFGEDAYIATHRLLVEHGLDIDYELFVREYSRVSDMLERQARTTRREFHMHDAGRAFFDCLSYEASPELVERFSESFVTEWNRGTVFYSGVEPFLDRLAGRYRLSILSNTNYPSLVHRSLTAMNVSHHFSQVVTSVEHGRRKPDPSIFETALTSLGIGPEAAIYIGDSFDDDYAGATAAGLRCILIDPENRYAGSVREHIRTLFDLEQLLALDEPTIA